MSDQGAPEGEARDEAKPSARMRVTSEQRERKADVPPFSIGSSVFRCYAALDQPGTPYVWRSDCKRLAVGKRIVRREVMDEDTGELVERSVADCWARVDGKLIGSDYPSLVIAMSMAAVSLAPARAAA